MSRLLAAIGVAVCLLMLSSAAAMAAAGAGGSNDLPAGAIVGLVVSFLIAGLVLLLSLGYILPKPRGR